MQLIESECSAIQEGQAREAVVASAGTAHLEDFFALSCDLFALGSLATRRWVRVNRAFETILGWREDELVDRPLFDIVHPADAERAETVTETLSSGRALQNFEIRMRCKEGGYRWIAWDTVLHPAEQLIFCVGRDVTRRRRRLHSLRALNHRIQRANDELEEFASTAGHDLEEPLRTLSLYSELLMREWGNDLSEGMSESLATIL